MMILKSYAITAKAVTNYIISRYSGCGSEELTTDEKTLIRAWSWPNDGLSSGFFIQQSDINSYLLKTSNFKSEHVSFTILSYIKDSINIKKHTFIYWIYLFIKNGFQNDYQNHTIQMSSILEFRIIVNNIVRILLSNNLKSIYICKNKQFQIRKCSENEHIAMQFTNSQMRWHPLILCLILIFNQYWFPRYGPLWSPCNLFLEYAIRDVHLFALDNEPGLI